jgi:hypothetical protein
MVYRLSHPKTVLSLWAAVFLSLLGGSLACSSPGRLLDYREMRNQAIGAVACNTHFQGYLCQDQGGTCSPLGQSDCNNHPSCSACSAAQPYSVCNNTYPWNYVNCTIEIVQGGCGVVVGGTTICGWNYESNYCICGGGFNLPQACDSTFTSGSWNCSS